MILFEQQLADARRHALAGYNVRFTGARQSGRSRILRALVETIEAAGVPIFSVAGDPVAVLQPGYVLEQLRAELGLPARPRDLAGVVDEIAAALPEKAVIAVDDVHEIDALSLRVLSAVRRRLGVRFLVTELIGRHRDTDFAAEWPEAIVEVPSLDLPGTGLLLREVLGAPADAAVVARVFGKSGGIAGLVVAIGESARDRGKLRMTNGVWASAGGSLWTFDLAGYLDSLLADTPPEIEAVVRWLSEGGASELAVATSRFGRDAVGAALDQRLIAASTSPRGVFVQAWPPALSERYKEKRSYVLRQLETAADGDSSQATVIAGDTSESNSAILARSFTEHTQRAIAASFAAWRESPTLNNALAYLAEALGARSEDARISAVFAETTLPRRGAGAAELQFVVRLSQHLLFQVGDVDAAQQTLNDFAAENPYWADSARTTVQLMALINGQGVTQDVPTHDDPADVNGILRLCVALAQGKVAVARDEVEHLAGRGAWPSLLPQMTVLLSVLEGDPLGAVAAAESLRKKALEQFDKPAFATLSYWAALAHDYLDDAVSAARVLEEGVVGGRPRLTMGFVYSAMLNMQATSAHLHGQGTVRDDLVRESSTVSPQVGPFLGMGLDVLDGLTRSQGERKEEGIAELVGALKARRSLGYTVGAVQTALFLLTLTFEPRIVSELQAAEAQMPGSGYARSSTLAGLLATAPLTEVRLWIESAPRGQDDALMARLISAAARRADDDHDVERSAGLHALADSIARPLGEGAQLSGASSERVALLSERERQVALLAETLTNNEIAERLSISRRTVENHVANALRKSGTSNRTQLAALVAGNRSTI
ncbi:DNA-binding CsgD family transcriptional regulator [Microbacterium natoriense]|uniref:DNA-binding CsgD family transcriptional regulator n=1 Tax=Microbacterium natoriense TaxID=284570 RepID=A0AAW8EVG4_9MICO|nr:helix-turn-helix transcriptional regulator [Microbacterium natoriense]MDQ0647257.1 DNA-binding CsgD family transcriptional regulator [Microbacterium natoriense]